MSQKFNNKYRSETTRLKGKNYSDPGKYFVTINTDNRIPFFGNISKNNMILSDIGMIAKTCYLEIPNHFNNVTLDEYVIMPDHIHGIIEIVKINDDLIFVDRPHGTDLQEQRNPFHHPEWHPGTLGVIINQFKSSVTRIVRKKFPGTKFCWQALFHDRIIRNDEYEKIKFYIRNNVQNWKNKK